MGGVIFLSYRRADAEGQAGRLYADLIHDFGPGAVFMDVSDILPGKDFRQAINDNVSKCAVMLAMIGPGWTTAQDASGARRLDHPDDFVRLEIAAALARGIDVIPVLVHGARMPIAAQLPEDLQNLAYRNSVELTHARWTSDVELFSRALREYVQPSSIPKEGGGDGTAVQSSAPQPTTVEAVRPLVRFAPLLAVVVVVVALSVWGYQQLKQPNKDASQASGQPVGQGQGSQTAIAPAASKAAATTAPTPAQNGAPGGQGLSGWWYVVTPPHLIPDGTPVAFYIAPHGDQFVVEMHAGAGDGGTSTSCGTQSVPLTNNGLSMVWNEPANPGCHFIRDGYAANVRLDLVGKNLQMTLTGKYPSITMEFKHDGAGLF